jgi:hypothetical protein
VLDRYYEPSERSLAEGAKPEDDIEQDDKGMGIKKRN